MIVNGTKLFSLIFFLLLITSREFQNYFHIHKAKNISYKSYSNEYQRIVFGNIWLRILKTTWYMRQFTILNIANNENVGCDAFFWYRKPLLLLVRMKSLELVIFAKKWIMWNEKYEYANKAHYQTESFAAMHIRLEL